jgi:DNA-binding PadR family transcriptional regulator
MGPLVYELFVLGELMVKPMYGFHLRLIARRILGPWRPLSWGVVYPLIRRLERNGLAISSTRTEAGALSPRSSGQPRRMYVITPAGRDRFMALMLSPQDYGRDTRELFSIKLTNFQFLNTAQKKLVLRWYRGYLEDLRSYYQEARTDVLGNAEISTRERPWIVTSIDATLKPLDTELAWVDRMINAPRSSTGAQRQRR